MPSLFSRPSKSKGRKGGILVIVASGLLFFLGLGALVVDVGVALAQRTRMQMAADAAALAGVKHLKKSESWVRLEAITVAKLNGYKIQGTDINVDPHAKEVRVHWTQPTGLILSPIFNMFQVKIGVDAVAGLVAIQDKLRVMPFIVPKDSYNLGSITKLKYGAGEGKMGNYGAAAIDGPGAKIYEQTISEGANTELRTGMFIDTEPGNMVGPTDAGVNKLIAGDTTSYDDAITKPNRRIVVVPVVDYQDLAQVQGRSQPIMIRGFARFYIIEAKGGVVTGRFIDHIFGNNAPPPNETRAKLVR